MIRPEARRLNVGYKGNVLLGFLRCLIDIEMLIKHSSYQVMFSFGRFVFPFTTRFASCLYEVQSDA